MTARQDHWWLVAVVVAVLLVCAAAVMRSRPVCRGVVTTVDGVTWCSEVRR